MTACLPVRRRVIPFVAACLLAAAPARPHTGGWELFPDSTLFPRITADALEHQLSLSRITDNREWIGAIGGAVPLAAWGDAPRLQAGAAATVFSRLMKTPGHITVMTVDYRVDVPLEAGLPPWVVRIAYGHRSAHYADDAIEQLGRRSVSAVKDYLAAGVAWRPAGVPLHLYGAATWNYHNEPETNLPWELQAGGEVRGPAAWNLLVPYAAADIKVKQEVGWGSTQSYEAGVRIAPAGRQGLRLAWTHRRGFEERGQVYRERVIMNLLTASLELR
jgi:hypothetical protein